MNRRTILLGMGLLGIALFLAACGGQTGGPEATACPEATCPEPVVKEVPFQELWAASPHADTSAPAFTHWDEEDPKEIPPECAKCHSEPGYLDFLGLDGSASGTVDKAAPTGTVVTCVTCHNDATAAMTSVVMPSGIEITGLGDEARCMQCHQGRESKVSVNNAVTQAGVDEDTVTDKLGFVNIHYFAAAATKYGTAAKGGYEYDGKTYEANFAHVTGFDTCIGCHNQHTLEVRVEACTACHTGAATVEDLKNVRMNGSLKDYDGDGDTQEGIYFELEGLREMLYKGIQAYASEVAGSPIVYDVEAYPYFFIDTNADGQVTEGEAVFPNGYASWTPRLLKAAYNYQVSLKDPGAFAHGGKYIIELLYDSIESLNEKIGTPVDLSTASRNDAGHFDGSAYPFRHFDEGGLVPGECAKCHSAAGLPTYLEEASVSRRGGTNIFEPVANGFKCETCHSTLGTEFARYEVKTVTFPSGARLSFGEEGAALDANLCIMCHQGNESTVSVNAAITKSAAKDDQVSDTLTFRNIHYFAAGATLFGSAAQGAYQYAGQTYLGRFSHVEGFNTCVNCHNVHALTVNVQACSGCHTTVKSEEDLGTIRGPNSTVDYDGDGDTTEGIAGEVETFRVALYEALKAYGVKNGAPIVYSAPTYPYFFADTNGNGEADPDEATFANGFKAWTPRLLRAAYNYQYSVKDPGAFAHNGKYVIQVLYDSLKDVGGSVRGMTRPTTPPQ